jgi:murein DD-endopeptidase MepM/ murein hydrolase activator NlpD
VGIVALFVVPLGLARGGPEGADRSSGVLGAARARQGATPQATATTVAEATAVAPLDVRGLGYPIAGACLPQNDLLMPGAVRAYRHGVPEGVDFYDSDNCVFIGRGTEVVAVKEGTVIRVDVAYEEMTEDAAARLLARAEHGEGNAEDVLDAFRGRQVWLDHGGGLVTRYCHLDGVAEGLTVGARVSQGTLIGTVGDSGTLESMEHPGLETHLHFEIRTGERFLGQGQAPRAVRFLYERAFSP